MKTYFMILIALLSLVIAGCGDEESTDDRQTKPNTETTSNEERILSDLPSKFTKEYLAEAAEKTIRTDNPKFNPQSVFYAEEIEVPGLWEKLNIQLAKITTDNDNYICDMLFYKGKAQFGIWTLYSPVLFDDKLYYAYTMGFGVIRSFISQVTVEEAEIKEINSDPYLVDCILGLKVVDNRVQVQTHGFTAFYQGDSKNKVGWVEVKDSKLVIVDDGGKELSEEDIDVLERIKRAKSHGIKLSNEDIEKLYKERKQTQPKGD